MITANIHYAKTHLSQLVEQAMQGEEILLCKAGKPVARVIAYEPASAPRQLGLWAGQVHIADDFDELPVELKDYFT
ncbi:MAG TPA: type II toxin-antitoxin system Phd/YefM family antitoxin [Gammaproteobacteria bacterium]|nr:type II toxin-antitoxin system Phd/YefM family antitoxin [Gammaproteobacteria bacterium]